MPEIGEGTPARGPRAPVLRREDESRTGPALGPATAAPGQAPARQRPPNIGDTERLACVAGGSLLVLLGLSRRSRFAGATLAGAGALLAYRGSRGHSHLYQRIGVDRPDAPVEILQSLTVNRPPAEVYRFWRELENLPRFMRHLQSVQRLSDTRSHWVARTVAIGRTVEWDAEIVEDVPGELLRWRSLPDGGLQHTGEVRFRPAPGGRGTELHVHMEYRPPLGAPLAALMYPFSKQMLKEEIRRLKQVLEAGEVATTEGQPSGVPHR